MRKITKEELKVILENHDKWLRREEGGEKAKLRGADLRGADLYGADLFEADLRGADISEVDLRRANLSEADLFRVNLRGAMIEKAELGSSKIKIFELGQHSGFYLNGFVTIGCVSKSLEEWLETYEEVGKKNNYTKNEIKEYGAFLDYLNHLKLEGIL